jgi:hypothetical protein
VAAEVDVENAVEVDVTAVVVGVVEVDVTAVALEDMVEVTVWDSLLPCVEVEVVERVVDVIVVGRVTVLVVLVETVVTTPPLPPPVLVM